MTDSFQTEFQIADRWIGAEHPPYLIAEMACAHEGKLDRAQALIDAAAAAGADAIQLQLFSAHHQVAPHHPLRSLLDQLAFSATDWGQLFKAARQTSLAVFAFVYDVPSLELALALGVDGLKLSSADLSNPEMLQRSAKAGCPVTLGTGASTLDEISAALLQFQGMGGTQVVLMHGVQNFPTAIADANLRRIQLLQQVFQLPVGYQDHTDASLDLSQVIDLTAVGLGACVIEKHITWDRAEQGTDYQAALEPKEWKVFADRLRLVSQALGTNRPTELTPSDRRYRQFQKKQVCAAVDIAEGEVITRDRVTFLRLHEGTGLSPQQFEHIQGQVAARSLQAFYPIQLSDVRSPDLKS